MITKRPFATFAGLAVALVLIGWPFLVDEQWLTVGAFIGIAVIGALSLQVLTGLTGLISLGQAAFFGLGAYMASALGPSVNENVDALLNDLPLPLAIFAGNDNGWPLFLGLLLAGSCAGFVALLIAPIATRLSGIYLAIVTLGLIFAAQHFFIHATWLTGGNQGVPLYAPAIAGFSFENKTTFAGVEFTRSAKLYYLTLVLACLAALSIAHLKRSKTGRALRAVRDNETAAKMAGINPNYYKILAFVIAGFMAGIAGALFGSQYGFALPETWDLNLSVMYLAMIVIGGLGLVRGAILGAVFVTALPPLLRNLLGDDLRVLGYNAPQLNLVVFGLAIIIFLLVAPGGLGRMKFDRLHGWISRRLAETHPTAES